MVTAIAPRADIPANKPANKPKNGRIIPEDNSQRWPRTIVEAYARHRGPYTIENATTLVDEEPLEIFNGWLVWQKMTEPEERRIAANIQEIFSMALRAIGWGQAYPDQFECQMKSDDVFKPDVCMVSNERFEKLVLPIKNESGRSVLKGGPEMVVENRSPSNNRKEKREKRAQYFENGTLVVWDVDPDRRKIWVYEASEPKKGREYKAEDNIECEPLLPGWRRSLADFFSKDLSAEQVVGEVAAKWRAESKAEGREEGRQEGQKQALVQILVLQARLRFGEDAAAELSIRLAQLNVEQLTALAGTVATSPTLQDWLNR